MGCMIPAAVNDRLNQQITNELGASHAYLGMACALEGWNLKVLAKRFMKQSSEERDHALKIVRYIQNVGGQVRLEAIPKPAGDYAKAEAIFAAAVDSELNVTRQINELVALAESERDYATRSFLQWFVDEQIEEVSSMKYLLDLARLATDMLAVETLVARAGDD